MSDRFPYLRAPAFIVSDQAINPPWLVSDSGRMTGYAEVMRWRVLVRMERFELSWVSPPPPQDGVSASSTTSAIQQFNWRHKPRVDWGI